MTWEDVTPASDPTISAANSPLIGDNGGRVKWWQAVGVAVVVIVLGAIMLAPVVALIVAEWRAVLHAS